MIQKVCLFICLTYAAITVENQQSCPITNLIRLYKEKHSKKTDRIFHKCTVDVQKKNQIVALSTLCSQV